MFLFTWMICRFHVNLPGWNANDSNDIGNFNHKVLSLKPSRTVMFFFSPLLNSFIYIDMDLHRFIRPPTFYAHLWHIPFAINIWYLYLEIIYIFCAAIFHRLQNAPGDLLGENLTRPTRPPCMKWLWQMPTFGCSRLMSCRLFLSHHCPYGPAAQVLVPWTIGQGTIRFFHVEYLWNPFIKGEPQANKH